MRERFFTYGYRMLASTLAALALLGGGTVRASFSNPVAPIESADPWVVRSGNFYYFLRTTSSGVTIRQSASLDGIGTGHEVTVFRAPFERILSNVWAPELHFFDGKWYIYACGSLKAGQFDHRMFVLESNAADPMGPYTYKGMLMPNLRAIDGNVLVRPTDGSRFLLFSGYDADGQCLYIAALVNPWTKAGAAVRISVPTLPWETIGAPINEGPQALTRGGKAFIAYSASGSWTPDYCLGLLVNTDGNYMNPLSWTKLPQPVFQRWDPNQAYSTGHNSFITSPDGGEDWLVYHATADPTVSQWGKRSTRIQKFSWSPDGYPRFGVPQPIGVQTPGPDELASEPSLKAFYKFEGNAADNSGRFQNGASQGGVSFVPGLGGGTAAQFNGTDSHITVPKSIDDDFTIAFWLKTTAAGGIGPWSAGCGLVDGDVAGQTTDFGVSLMGNTVAFGVGNPDTTIVGTAAVNNGAWHHVVATRRGATGSLTLHIDGQVQATGSGSTTWRAAAAVLRIGGLLSGGGRFTGAIDEVRLYDRVLASGEIALLSAQAAGAQIRRNMALKGISRTPAE